MINFGVIVAMNSGGPVNLILNLAFGFLVLVLLLRLSRPCFSLADPRPIVVFERRGFSGLCGYLALLYGVTYVYLRPEGLPSAGIQLLTFVFYGLALVGLWLHQPGGRSEGERALVGISELRVLINLVVIVLGLGLVLSFFRGTPMVFLPVVAGFLIWTPLGLLLMAIAIAKGAARLPIRGPT
jgi:hypothetical protein